MEHPSARDRQRKNASIHFADGLVRRVLLAREKNQNDYTVPLARKVLGIVKTFFQEGFDLPRKTGFLLLLSPRQIKI